MNLWLLLAGLSLQGPPGADAPEGFETLQPHAAWCGPRVLYFFARWSGSGATLEDVVRLCEPDAEGYTSLAKLSEAARKLGLEPRAARLTPEQITALQGPAILCVRKAFPAEKPGAPPVARLHYFGLARARGDDLFWTLDTSRDTSLSLTSGDALRRAVTGECLLLKGCNLPSLKLQVAAAPAWARWGPAAALALGGLALLGFARSGRVAKSWGVGALACSALLGLFLVAAERPAEPSAPAPSKPAVAAAAEPKQQEIHDFGVVRHQKILSHEFFLANAGDQEASCTLVRKSCECLKADLPAKIPAGQRGKIPVHVNLENREGELVSGLVVATGKRPEDETLYALKCFVHPPPWAVPSAVAVRDAVPGEKAPCVLHIHWPHKRQPLGVAAGTEDGAKLCTVQAAHPAVEVVSIRPAVLPAKDGKLPKVVLTLSLLVDTARIANDRTYRADEGLKLKLNGPEGADDLSIPLEASFRHHARLEGAEAVFLSAANGYEGTIRLASRAGEPFTIESVAFDRPERVVCRFAAGEGRPAQELRFRAAKAKAAGVETLQAVVRIKELPGEDYRLAVFIAE